MASSGAASATYASASSNVRTAATIEEALALVADAAPEEAIFITGSLFLVAEARAALPNYI